MGEVVDLSHYRKPNPGNGGRAAVDRFFSEASSAGCEHLSQTDRLLIWLWLEGFKIVPLEPQDVEHG